MEQDEMEITELVVLLMELEPTVVEMEYSLHWM